MYVYIWISFFPTSFPNFTFTLRMCLVEWILGRMEKNEKKKEGKLFGRRSVGRERGKKWMGLGCFLPKSTTKFSLQNREKTMATEFDLFIDQNAHVHLHMGFCPILFICLFVFIYFSLVPILSICLLCSFFFLLLSWN